MGESGALLPKTRGEVAVTQKLRLRVELRRLQRLDTSGGFDQRSPICARRRRDIKDSQRLAPFGVGALSCAVCTGTQLALPNTRTKQFKGSFRSRLRTASGQLSGTPGSKAVIGRSSQQKGKNNCFCILEATTTWGAPARRVMAIIPAVNMRGTMTSSWKTLLVVLATAIFALAPAVGAVQPLVLAPAKI